MTAISMPSVARHVNTLVLLRFALLPSIPHCTDSELDSTGFQFLQRKELKEIYSSPNKVRAGSKAH